MRATTLAASLSVLVAIASAVTASAGGIGASGGASAGGIGASGGASVGGGGIGASGGARAGGIGASGGASVGGTGFGASGSASVGGFGASGSASVGSSAGASTNFGGTLSRGKPTFSTTALPLNYAPKRWLNVPLKKLLALKEALGQLNYRDFRTLKHKCAHVLQSARSFMTNHVLVCKIATENLAEVSRRVQTSSTQKLDCTEVLQLSKRYGKTQQQVCAIVAARL
jgi:hypothetical protein